MELKIKLTKKQTIAKERYKKFICAQIDKELTLKQIGKRLGVSDVFVYYLFMGHRKSKSKEKKLCRILGIDYEEVKQA